ncbi:transposase [Geodermatophilus maliterrae]|uniref:Transposase n=1 Tax=Geodermatophilus maliterrae TaxID=3162531 RepID=A0ABV3XJS6_9ACTN
MAEQLGLELVPDGLWDIVEPFIPPQTERPQGGGPRYVEDRAAFTAIVYVLTIGCAWRHLPAEFEVSTATAHRRFVTWTQTATRGRPGSPRGTRMVSSSGSSWRLSPT